MSACNQPKSGENTDLRPVESSVLYEVNVRQYTPEGTFNAFAEHLPRLKSLGVDILWIMPIHPISKENRKGTLGSYYAIQDYRAVNPEFGTIEDFKNLVKKAHTLGFRVLIDWVANHTGWDNPLLTQHPDWFLQKDGKIISPVEDWSDVAGLDYKNKDLRRYMIESMEFWLKEADIDGFRCDVAAMVPTDFWNEARKSLDKVKPVFMLAEAWEPELVGHAFDAGYAWDLHHLMNDIAQGKKNGNDLCEYFAKTDTFYNSKSILMNFLDNHDENSHNGTIEKRMGEAFKSFALLIYTVPGMPLIYTGQEVGMDKSLLFFDKDCVDWSTHPELSEFYAQLDKLKHDNPALKAGKTKGSFNIIKHDNLANVFAFTRESGKNKVMVIINLTDKQQTFNIQETSESQFSGYFGNGDKEFAYNIILKPYEYNCYFL
jgi:glycosidase